ncbi:hypothetical protein JAAARDRAFT_29443 [Jaapia argillacea MUCL 33604]|uniref:WW domain-containing protein n=1 Tax=Jaapia argillacea MUCL 33604 TaxID=933084 RepID=A0A067QLB6_9AGAM|nr:hypothetical protein JAAARDRAFT_29443 [Jaapia argillacea MUCL 33604]
MTSVISEMPLPSGWAQEWDPNQNHPFWVDTKANPPRAIWTHPYEDEQYLDEHPEVRQKVLAQLKASGVPDSDNGGLGPPPAYDDKDSRRHSYAGDESPKTERPSYERHATTPPPEGKGKGKAKEAQKRGFFGKMKDKAIGTKEEREEAKRQQKILDAEREKRRQELMKQRMEMMQQRYGQGYPGQSASSSRYGPPTGNPYAMSMGGNPYYSNGPDPYGYGGYGGGYGGGFGGGYGRRRGGGFGGGGLAVPLLGGLAGGLLLGDVLDGGFGGGGFDGGGGFGGGDFGGGGGFF